MLTPYTEDLLAGPTRAARRRRDHGHDAVRDVLVRAAHRRRRGHGTGQPRGGRRRHRHERDEQTINFILTADLADVSKNARDAAITGCPFTAADVGGDGTVTVTVKPKIWFSFVDFSELAPGTPEAPTVADPSTTAYIAFSLGLVQLSAYAFAFSPAEQAP